MYPTLSTYLEKARSDFKERKNSPNDEYLRLEADQSSLKKRIKNRLKSH